jgi:hypothetical protein
VRLMGAIENYRRVLRRSIDGRPLILTGGAVREPIVAAARSLGSPKVLAIHEEADLVGADSWATFAEDDWREVVEVFDPLHEALALGNNRQYSPEMAGRRFVEPSGASGRSSRTRPRWDGSGTGPVSPARRAW